MMIKKMRIGDCRFYDKVITQGDVLAYAKITGDHNPAHYDEDYTKTTIFKKPIVHGMFVGSLFSKIFGMDYPGEGTIYCSQSLTFLKPVYPNTRLLVKVTVKTIVPEKNRVIFTTEVFDNDDVLLLTGEAMLMPRRDKAYE